MRELKHRGINGIVQLVNDSNLGTLVLVLVLLSILLKWFVSFLVMYHWNFRPFHRLTTFAKGSCTWHLIWVFPFCPASACPYCTVICTGKRQPLCVLLLPAGDTIKWSHLNPWLAEAFREVPLHSFNYSYHSQESGQKSVGRRNRITKLWILPDINLFKTPHPVG